MFNDSALGHGRLVLAGLIDASLPLALVATVFITKKPEGLYSSLEGINGSLLVLIVFVVYRLLSLLFFRQTLGMKLFRLVLRNGEEQPLTWLENVLAALFVLYRGTHYYTSNKQ